jgi:membrane protease YdiL (CAAX protease family)
MTLRMAKGCAASMLPLRRSRGADGAPRRTDRTPTLITTMTDARAFRLDDDFLPRIGTAPPGEVAGRRDTVSSVRWEIVLVFAITLGMSGLRSLVSIIETQIKAHQAQVSLGQMRVSVAAPKSSVNIIDLVYQLLSIVQGLAWGGLGLYLLWRAGASLSRHLGLNLRRPGHDVAAGVGLAALIGIPGLALYLIGNALGITLTVQASTMTDVWWRAPVSVLIAFQNGFLEECLVVGYLLVRLRQLDLRPWAALAISAVLRGSYHLYQGYGGFAGNVVMGLVFGFVFLRWRRLWPLVIAHGLIDTVAIVGYPLLHGHVSWLP